MRTKNILIISDSLSLPRNKPEIVEPHETWPSILKEQIKDSNIITLAIGGGTIKDLYEQSRYYTAFKPDIIIIQSGIVDCAPRALGRLENEIINSNRLLSFISQRILPIDLFRKIRKKTYTSKDNFEKYIKKIIELYSGKRVIWIGILPANIEYEKKVKGINRNIILYNEILKKMMQTNHNFFLSTDHIPINGIMSDYHHLNKIGNTWIAQKILTII